MAYGSPERVDDVEKYFTGIRGGVRPSESLLEATRARYRAVGGKTPLNEITRAQAEALQTLLDQRAGVGMYRVFIGMKYWDPLIHDTITEIVALGITEVIAIALAPHYSRISIGGYKQKIDDAVSALHAPLRVSLIEAWHAEPHLIACISEQLEEAFAKFPNIPREAIKIFFTAHSLPEKILAEGDPYRDQLLETAQLVAANVGITNWQLAFQSRGKTSDVWMGPDINEALHSLNSEGGKYALVCPIGFTADNLEIVYDIDIQAQATARASGITLLRTASRNTHPLFIDALATIVINAHH